MAKLLASFSQFTIWLTRELISPVIAEERRILEHSTSPVVIVGGDVRSHLDRSGDAFRLKVWEVAHFPFAKEVPPRVEPVPEELPAGESGLQERE